MRETRPSGRDTRVMLLLVTLNVALRMIVAMRPLTYLDGLTIPDDAYLSLTLSRNIAAGLGPMYGEGFTNGFQPLYVFLMTFVFRLVPDDPYTAVHIALIVLVVFDSLALVVLYRLVRRWSASGLTPLVVASVWITNPHVIGITLNGLETAVVFFFQIVSLSYFDRHFNAPVDLPNGKQAFVFGILLGFSCLARIDSMLLVGSLIAVLLWRSRATPERVIHLCLILILGIAVVVLPWIAYSFAYTGDVFPISGSATRFWSLAEISHEPGFSNWYWPLIKKAAERIGSTNLAGIVLIGALIILITLRGGVAQFLQKQFPQRLMPAMLFALALISAYTFYIFGHWHFGRYLFPVILVVMLTLAIVVDVAFSTMRGSLSRYGFATLVIGAVVFINMNRGYFRELLGSVSTNRYGYMNLGLWAKNEFTDGTILGSAQTGALGYFATNQMVVNLDGVVNREAYEALRNRTIMKYARKAGIEYVVDWPSNIEIIREHQDSFEMSDLLFVKEIPGFRTRDHEWQLMRVSSVSRLPDGK